jgi:hypothetical protein
MLVQMWQRSIAAATTGCNSIQRHAGRGSSHPCADATARRLSWLCRQQQRRLRR